MALPPTLAFARRLPSPGNGMGPGWCWCGRAGVTSAWLGGGWTKVLPRSEGPAMGSATSERDITRHHVSFPCEAEGRSFLLQLGFPPKQTIFPSGGREVEGGGLFSVVSGVPGHRNNLKAGHTEVTHLPCGGPPLVELVLVHSAYGARTDTGSYRYIHQWGLCQKYPIPLLRCFLLNRGH